MSQNLIIMGKEIRRRREELQLSQRELSLKAGLPQSHLSRLEQGLVNAKYSTLLELARTLELELILIPRQLLPGIDALKQGQQDPEAGPQPAYRLEDDDHG